MRRISDVLKERYGEKIYKLSLTSGCTCPNRDGRAGYGGCVFCSEGGSGEFAAKGRDIEKQIEEAKERIRRKTDARRFIAYFQSFSNTYGDVNRLKALYERVIRRDDIVILSLATRPDCLGDEVMEMLAELNRIKPVWVELGLQTMHDATARSMNRGYPLSVFDEAVKKLKQAGLQVIVHVIFGLPGETKEDMLQTVRYLSTLRPGPDGIKLQMLNILKGTVLADRYEADPFPLLSLEAYTDLVAESIRILPEEMIIHRVTGDGPANLLIAPGWVRDKKKVLNTITRKTRSLT
ncbi:MAG: TIGR01212 family radical SAM protein [Lachnospiraceae bacterium]|nr:TIGR01212 family radical SAM protein [Lachnospiraceae bacterium]